jgi:hypothetical protein
LKRIGLGPLTVEGIPRGRYRLLERKEAETLRKGEKAGKEDGGRDQERNQNLTQRPQRAQGTRRSERKTPV